MFTVDMVLCIAYPKGCKILRINAGPIAKLLDARARIKNVCISV